MLYGLGEVWLGVVEFGCSVVVVDWCVLVVYFGLVIWYCAAMVGCCGVVVVS